MNNLLKLTLLLSILSPLSQINAGFGYYAGRVAQGLTRGALVAVPGLVAVGRLTQSAKQDSEMQLEFEDAKKNEQRLTNLNSSHQQIKATEAQVLEVLLNDYSHLSESQQTDIARHMLQGSQDYIKARSFVKSIGFLEEIRKKISEKINVPLENTVLTSHKYVDNLEGSMAITKFKRHDGTLASIIFMHKAILRDYESDPKKIAVTLEHEAAHFNCDHIKQKAQFIPAINALAAGIGSYWATRKINPSTLSTAKLFTKSLSHTAKLAGSLVLQILACMQFSQYHEREADAIALQKTTDIDELNYHKDFLESAKKHYPAVSSNSAQLFSSHPTLASRIAKVDARIQELQALAEKGDK